MNYTFRTYNDYAIVELIESNLTIDLGMLDTREVETLVSNLKDLIFDLERFLKNTK